MSPPLPLGGKARSAKGAQICPPHGRPKEGSLPLGGKARSAKGAHMNAPGDGDMSSLAGRVGRALAERCWKVATAESCTGGLIAGAITDVAGSSDWFDRGFVTYSNEAKVEMLGVGVGTLAAHGAVSEAVAREMASGALARSRADLALSVTGVAGPSGGSADKPVGMVCFAWAQREGAIESATRRFDGNRAAVREATVIAALEGLIRRASVSV